MSMIPTFLTGSRSNVFDPFSSEIWDPFQGFSSAIQESSRETAAIANARIDWKETPEAHVFKADLPGLKKEEVKVEVEEGRVLQISGERSRENEEKNEKWHRVERSSGKFVRRFRLPENAKMEEVKAAMENGVLTVTVPKAEEKKSAVKVNMVMVVEAVVAVAGSALMVVATLNSRGYLHPNFGSGFLNNHQGPLLQHRILQCRHPLEDHPVATLLPAYLDHLQPNFMHPMMLITAPPTSNKLSTL
ncbi:hypothetical protein E3N88_03336 [Mikania micrantha]|uniref:SHSP domain-containing protein n=1 Tax=Mikania micrantha TaxID=192012 RepID=A0A5N6Q929_9ASTR|nr:hypothetical protein E3N88_03336 [Mikania micrantha]